MGELGDSRGVIGLLVDANVQICISCIWSVGFLANTMAAVCHGEIQLVKRRHEGRLSTETCSLRQDCIDNIMLLYTIFNVSSCIGRRSKKGSLSTNLSKVLCLPMTPL